MLHPEQDPPVYYSIVILTILYYLRVADLMRKLYDERGNVYFGVDEEIRERLQAKLMRAILTFRAE